MGKMGLFQECRVIRSVADSQDIKKWLIHSMWVMKKKKKSGLNFFLLGSKTVQLG